MATYRKRRRVINPRISKPWDIHGAGDKEIQKTESILVKDYHEQLDKLHGLLGDFYVKNSRNGLVTYADVAANKSLDTLLADIRREVDEAFIRRRIVIRAGLRSAGTEGYTDILYQAEKLAYAREAAKNKTNIVPFEKRLEPAVMQTVDAEIDRFMHDGVSGIRPTDDALDALNEQAKARLQDRVRGALAGQGIDLSAWQAILKDELEKDAGRCLKVVHMDGTRVINEARVSAFESRYAEELMKRMGIDESGSIMGLGLVLVWRHDEPKTPRQTHKDVLDGTVADLNGLWWSNGFSARGPGQFGDDTEDAGCRCYLELVPISEAKGMSTEAGVVPIPEDYLKRRAA